MSLRRQGESRKQKNEDVQRRREQYINAVVSSREDWSSNSTTTESEATTITTTAKITIPTTNTMESSTYTTPTTMLTTLASSTDQSKFSALPPLELQRFLLHNQQQFSQSQHNLNNSPTNFKSPKPHLEKKAYLTKQSSFHRYLSLTFSDPSKTKPKPKVLSGLQVNLNFQIFF